MKAYLGFVDDTGLRAFLPDDERLGPLMRSGQHSAWVWAALPAEGVTEIEAELRSGHRVEALEMLQSLAVDLRPVETASRHAAIS